MNNYKKEKIDSLLKEILAEVLQREVEWREEILISVSKVSCQADFSLAKIWLDVWPKEAGIKVRDNLIKKQGLIRAAVARKIDLRRVPRLKFLIDEEEWKDEGQRQAVEEIIAKLKEERRF